MTRNAKTLKLDASLGLFIFRVVVGFLFTLHGTAKIFGWPTDAGKVAEFGAWPSWWVGVIELAAGLLVMAGLFTRAAAFLASGAMAVAYFWKHQPDGLFPIQNGGDSAALYSFAFLLLVFTGAGAWALDNLRGARTGHASSENEASQGADEPVAAGAPRG